MTLLTSNPSKYEPFAAELAALGLVLAAPPCPLPEVQADTLAEVAAAKARAAARVLSTAVVVDDAGLSLAAFPGFPGPMTGHALRTLGRRGLKALVADDDRAEMVCVLAWSDGVETRCFEGRAEGRLDPERSVVPGGPGPLASWFVCPEGPLAHRARALAALAAAQGRFQADEP